MEWRDAFLRRRSLFADWEWDQIAIIGEFGAGKTVLANYAARHWFGLGHPTFSNAATLFGWRMDRETIYTAMGRIPACSTLVIDEGSAALSSRMGAGMAIDSFVGMGLNIRKKNCKLIIISAQDHMIAYPVLRDCKQVWMPVGRDQMVIAGEGPDGTEGRVDPAHNYDNFRLAWHVWDDYPYRKRNLIEGKTGEEQKGFGKPSYSMYADGDQVRRAYLLTDSFELAAAGAARVADTDAIREDLDAFHDEQWGHERNGHITEEQRQLQKIVEYVEEREYETREYFQAGEIASHLGVSLGKVGWLMKKAFDGVQNVQRKGYPAIYIYAKLNELRRLAVEQDRNGHN